MLNHVVVVSLEMADIAEDAPVVPPVTVSPVIKALFAEMNSLEFSL